MSWPSSGVVISPGLLPDHLIDAYCKVRAPLGPEGYTDPTSYTKISEMRDLLLCAPLSELLGELCQMPMALHLTLTGWVSTERSWHQDHYLNPPTDYTGDAYAGVWCALDDISPDSGPFTYVPGSHRWAEPLSREKVLSWLEPDARHDPAWPRRAEPWVTPYWDKRIAEAGVEPVTWVPRRGDVCIWHQRLVHCGATPATPGAERRALIAHFSGVDRRGDVVDRLRRDTQGWWFDL